MACLSFLVHSRCEAIRKLGCDAKINNELFVTLHTHSSHWCCCKQLTKPWRLHYIACYYKVHGDLCFAITEQPRIPHVQLTVSQACPLTPKTGSSLAGSASGISDLLVAHQLTGGIWWRVMQADSVLTFNSTSSIAEFVREDLTHTHL